MDWMICSTSDWMSTCSTCPDIKSHAQQISEGMTFAKTDDCDLGGILMKATGATSGHQTAVVNAVMSQVRHADRPLLRTLEWALCQKDDVSDECWDKEGFGRPGDSGSWVIGEHDNVVYGMSWGRDREWTGQIVTLFTPIFEILADINQRKPFTTFAIPGMPAQNIKTYLRILDPISDDPVSSLSAESAASSEEEEGDQCSIEEEPELRSAVTPQIIKDKGKGVEKFSDLTSPSHNEPEIVGEEDIDSENEIGFLI